jgi:7-cyano-7-deazaguanine synthase
VNTTADESVEHLLLLSGGIDSATLLGFLIAHGRLTRCLHIDYGQRARGHERGAALAISEHYGVPIQLVSTSGIAVGGGEIRGRNAFLLHLALLVAPEAGGVVTFGIHAGSGYRDCEPAFVSLMQSSFDFHSSGTLTVAAPFVSMTKEEIYRLARSMEVPLNITYSCESGDSPCGQCPSCLDRESLLARTY